MARTHVVDWTDLPDVVEFADELGYGMVVVKYDDRNNYNITHLVREDLWLRDGVKLIYSTGMEPT
jgi:hypothetical protein